MNIALLHYSAPPVVGGVESVLAHHARLMAEAGHAVRIVAARGAQTDRRIPFVAVPLADSRHPEVLAAKAQLDAGRRPAEFESLADRLVTALRGVLTDAQVLIAHNVCSLNKNLPLTAALHRLNARPGSPRLILWHHDLAWTTPRYRAELYDGDPWDLLRTAWPGVTQVVVSELRRRELSELMDLPPEKIRVVPNGVDAGAFLKLEAQTRALVRRLDVSSAEPLLLLPVRITRRKNIELALRVLAHLRADLPRARLIVTGPLGPHNPANAGYFAQLTALRAELGLEGAAHFLAELIPAGLPDSVIADFFRLADALFLPSREEGFGIPVLEAAFSHLPVFCADLPPLRELGLEEAVYFAPDAAPDSVAAALADHLRTNRAYRLAARARANYTWERIYLKHIAPLLSGTEDAR
jgi:glycosyltransferase involved in cell wall biosynthesis